MTPDESIEDLIRGAMPETIVTNYIVVAETLGPDGPQISIGMSDNMTPWLATGMLQFGLDMLHTADDDEEE